jgi:hypothetical protein
MPRIPIYEQRVSPSGSLGPRPEGDTFSAARALPAIASGLDSLQGAIVQRREEDAAAWSAQTLAQAQSEWTQALIKRKQEAPLGAPDFTPQLLTDFDEYQKKTVAMAPTKRTRQFLEQRFTALRGSLGTDALAFEAASANAHATDIAKKSIDSARVELQVRPDAFADRLAERAALIDSMRLPAAAKQDLTDYAQQSMSRDAVLGLIQRDPRGTLERLNAAPGKSETLSIETLTADDRIQMRNAAEAEVRRLDAEGKSRLIEARQALTDQQRDILAAAELGLPITSAPNRAQFVAAFGEREGEQRYQSVQLASKLSGQVAELNQLPTAELVKRVESFKPSSVEGAADKAPMYAFLGRAVSGILTAREKDPAGYLVQNSPTVKSAWTALHEARDEDQGDAAQSYLRAVNAERERLGIASLEVLPKSYAEAIVAELTRPQENQNLAAKIAAEAERWGPAWPRVYRQVAKDLPDTALVIGAGIPQRAANALATVTTLTDEQIKAQVLTIGTTWKDLQDKVDGELAEMGSTFGPEGAPTLTAIRSSAQKLTAAYMAQGSSLSEAATQAAKDLANERYAFNSFRGRTYRVPVDIDADLVDEGATLALSQFTAMTGTVQRDPGQPEETTLSQATERIRRSGYWVTAPDESGLRLYVNGQPVPMPGGRPLQLTWEELRTLGAERELQMQEALQRAESERREGKPGAE